MNRNKNGQLFKGPAILYTIPNIDKKGYFNPCCRTCN